VPEKDRTDVPREAGEDEAKEANPSERVDAAAASEEGAERSAGSDEAAARVAAALGVDGGEGEAEEGEASKEGEQKPVEAKQPKAPSNRAARRRDETRKRRGASADDLPKDRNARAKELLMRRQEQAAERRPVQLGAGEMVEDVVARATSGAGKWLRKNFAVLQWGIVAGLVVMGGVFFYMSRVEKKEGSISDALADAVAADRGRVMPEDKRSDDEKELDPTKIYKSAEERSDAALAAYNKVIDQHGGTGAALLAKLGQAGVLLEKKQWGPALEAYSAVSSSTLAGADPDVKGRSLEGMAFAKEGKGDLDGALASFKELESIDAKGYKELGLYHQARILIAKGDKEKAKELLQAASKGLKGSAGEQNPFQWLEGQVEEALRKIDPSAAPPRTQLGPKGGGALSPEELQRLIEQARQNAEKKLGGEHEGE